MALNFSTGQKGTLTAVYHDGPPGPDGSGTGNVVATPATTTWVSSDPTILAVQSTGASTASFNAIKPGNVTLTLSVPAATDDAGNSYSAFSGDKSASVAGTAIKVIGSFNITITLV